jgi:hypothetical protein
MFSLHTPRLGCKIPNEPRPYDPPDVDSVISLNSLTGFFCPQNLKLIGYIKNRKVIIILVDSGNTNNFIHHRIAQ